MQSRRVARVASRRLLERSIVFSSVAALVLASACGSPAKRTRVDADDTESDADPGTGTGGHPAGGSIGAGGAATGGTGGSGGIGVGGSGAGGMVVVPDAGSGKDGRPPDANGNTGGMGGSGAGGSDGGIVPPPPPGTVNWTTHKFNNARTGWNPYEKVLNPTNVADVAKFGKLFSHDVDGQIYAQPLVVSGLNVGGKVRNVVYIVTMKNNAYAFDADDATAKAPLWMVNFGVAPTIYAVLKTMPGMDCCQDIKPVIGATSTPVIDVTTSTMYMTTKTTEAGKFAYKLHALDLVSGAEKFGGPTVIGGSVPGNALGSANGMVAFDPQIQLNRPALLLQGGAVYIAFGSHGDQNNFNGWVFGYDAATLMRKALFCTTPLKGRGGAIWQSGNGLVGDGESIFFATGNGKDGATDPMSTPPGLGEALVRLDGNLVLKDWQIRTNYNAMDGVDDDFGISGPMLIPNTDRLIQGGKDMWALLYDKNNLGKFSATDDPVLQKFKGDGPSFSGFHAGGFTFFEGANGPMIFAWPAATKMLGFKVGADKKIVTAPAIIGPDNAPPSRWGIGMMVVSSDGPSNGIIWVTMPDGNVNGVVSTGKLKAYNALDGKALWNSTLNKARDDVGLHATQNWPTVVNGKVYVPSWNGSMLNAGKATTSAGALHVYGLLP